MIKDLITFHQSGDLGRTRAFYMDVLGFSLWKDQGKCLIFDAGGQGKSGFCQHFRTTARQDDCLTVVVESKDEVDRMRERIVNAGYACTQAEENTTFRIYHFFTRDPDGLRVECQVFL
jgi:predicted enzyme related to lactoylglutathione lyase